MNLIKCSFILFYFAHAPHECAGKGESEGGKERGNDTDEEPRPPRGPHPHTPPTPHALAHPPHTSREKRRFDDERKKPNIFSKRDHRTRQKNRFQFENWRVKTEILGRMAWKTPRPVGGIHGKRDESPKNEFSLMSETLAPFLFFPFSLSRRSAR
jgi:hypothetical protein